MIVTTPRTGLSIYFLSLSNAVGQSVKAICALSQSNISSYFESRLLSSTETHMELSDLRSKDHLCNKYSWSQEGLNDLVSVISDNESELALSSLLQCITNLCDTNVIAEKLDEYISQACQRVFRFSSRERHNRKHVPPWYDNECRYKRHINADVNDPLPLRPGNGSILSLKRSNRILCVANTGHVSKENRENIIENALKI